MDRIAFAVAVSMLSFVAIAEGAIVKKPIEYKHDSTTLEGFLCYDDALTGKRPGVLIVHEWWGCNDYAKSRAEQLAKLGYVAFALDMYGKGVTTKKPDEASRLMGEAKKVLRPRAKAGLDVLLSQPNVDKDKVCAIGYCMGGTTALELAYSGAPLAGVVSFHGNLTLPSDEDARRIRAKILVCHGAADAFQPEKEVAAWRDAMHKTKADWQMIYYANAVHAFTNPNADKAGIPGVAYDRHADTRSWRHMQDFFNEVFGEARATR